MTQRVFSQKKTYQILNILFNSESESKFFAYESCEMDNRVYSVKNQESREKVNILYTHWEKIHTDYWLIIMACEGWQGSQFLFLEFLISIYGELVRQPMHPLCLIMETLHVAGRLLGVSFLHWSYKQIVTIYSLTSPKSTFSNFYDSTLGTIWSVIVLEIV